MRLILAGALLLLGCYNPSIPNGALKCSSSGSKCPEGFHCAADGTCWKNGTNPTPMVDMAQPPQPDMAQPRDMAMLPQTAHKGSSILSGGVTAKSESYKVIMSTGQPPGGTKNAASETMKKRSGLAGTTQ